MVAIVSGNSLGLSSTSLYTLGQRGTLGSAPQGRSGEQSFINIANGNLVLQDRDDRVAGHGLDLVALRTYNSQGKFSDDNGDNWSLGVSSQQAKLTGTLNTAGSTITRTDKSGSEAVYVWDASKSRYLSTDGAGAYDTFVANGSQYVWTDGDTGVMEFYDTTTGRLSSASDVKGNTLSYAYNAAGNLTCMSSSSGDVIYLDYVGSNLSKIRTVTTEGVTLTRVSYTYDASNRLSTVTVDLTPDDNSVADGKVYQTTYTYDGASKRVASVTQSDGTSLAFTYVLTGTDYRIATATDGLGHTTNYSYDTTNRRTTVVDPLGLVTIYEYDAVGQLTKITAPAVGGVTQSNSFIYSASGDLLRVIDGEGHTFDMEYDANGNQILQRDSAGNTVTRTFDAHNQVLTETVYVIPDPDGAGVQQPGSPLTTRYVYDETDKNLLRFVLSPAGRVTEYRYNTWGDRIASIQYSAAAYSVGSLAATAVPSESAMASWAGSQNLALTSRSDMVVDARGQVQTLTVYSKVDSAGNGVLDGTQSATQYVYDQAGQLLKTISGASGVTLYTYDGLGRLTSVQDALSQTTITSYDDAGNKTTVTFANGLTTTSVFDRAGRLASVQQSTAQTANLGVTRYFYDADNRLVMTQDPTGVRAWQVYDEDGRKVAAIDGNGSLTEYVYNKNNQITQTIVYASAVNIAALTDGSGQPVNLSLSSIRPTASATDQKSWRIYDAANRLVKTVDAQGAVVEMQYDGASRLVQVIGYANLVAIGALGAAPLASAIAPVPSVAADRIVRNFYDGDGVLLATLDAEGYLTELHYDGAARLVGRTAYATATVAGLRATGTLAQLVPAANVKDVTTRLILNAKGQISGEIDAEGYLTETVYDASGNVTLSVRYATAVDAGALASLNLSTTVQTLRPISVPEDRSSSFVYDQLNRVLQATDPSGTITQYVYDSLGNLVKKTVAAGSSESRTLTARYDVQGRLIGELTGIGSALLTGTLTQPQVDAIWSQYGLTHTYDAAGRRTSSTDANGNRTLFFYDADGRLTHSVNALGEVRENQYNVLGQLVSTTTYGARISLAGLIGANAGGLVNAALTTAINAVRNLMFDSVALFTYSSTGELNSSTDALGNTTSITFNAFGNEIGRIQTLGGGQTLAQATSVDRRGLQIESTLDAANINAITSAVYDAFGRLTSSVDANGHVRTQTFDRLGRVVSTFDPLNIARSTTYDAFGRALTQTDGLGQTTTYTYNKAQRSVTITTPENIGITTVYTRLGQTQSVTDGRGNASSYTYDLNGNVLATATALTTISNTYDRGNRLTSTTDANGNQVVLSYDAANRVLTRTVDPAGLNLVTSYAYDAKGQQISVTDPAGTVTQLVYDLKGQLIRQVVDPTGLNLVTAYAYDARGKTLTVTNPLGVITRYVYDKLGRRTSEQTDPAGLNLTRSYIYDKVGNVTSMTDANGNVTRYAYDADDRLVYAVDASGNLQQNSFDADGRIVKTVKYATPISLAALAAAPTLVDIAGRLTVSAADAVDNRVYDRDGRLSATVNGLGEVVTFTYDAAGNITDRVAYANRIAMSGGGAWVAGTAPAPVADPAHDQRTRAVYDQLGRAIWTVDGNGAVVKQTFDGNGNVVDRIAYAHVVPVTTAATDSAIGTAVAVVADAARDSHIRRSYDTANRLQLTANGVGAVTQFSYNKNGQIVKEIDYAVPVAASAALASAVASPGDRITVFAYDHAGRQTYALDALGGVTRSVYDNNGNLTQRLSYSNAITPPTAGGTPGEADIQALLVPVAANDRIERYAYDSADRRVFVVDATGAASEKTYDAAGNVVQTTAFAKALDVSGLSSVATVADIRARVVADAANDRAERRVFDASQRMIYGVDALGYVRKTSYDGLGQIKEVIEYALAVPAGTANTAAAVAGAVVVSAAADRTSSFSYDAAGRLLSSTDPLGYIESYTYNGLGEKLTFTNKKGSVWSYDYDASGRLVQETSPQVALATVVVNAGGTLEVDEVHSGSAGVITRLAYDALNNLSSRTEAFGRAEQRMTSYEYDALGRQIRTIYPAVNVYNAVGDNLTTNGATGLATRVETAQVLSSQTTYDALGNAVSSRDVAGNSSYKAYDKLGNVSFEVDALGFVTSYTRDAWGKVTKLTRFSAATTLTNNSPASLSAAQIGAAVNAVGVGHGSDRILLTEYDRAGRAVKVTEPMAYVYDPDAAGGGQYFTAGKTTRNIFNAFGDLTRTALLKNPVTDTWTSTAYYFDKRSQQVAGVDAMGYLNTQAFDAAGNVVGHTEFATAIASWNGSLPSAAIPGAVTSADDRSTLYAFDRNNRKTSEVRVNVEYSDSSNATSSRGNLTTAYGYDAVGNLTRTTDTAGASTYSYYDALGRVTAVAEPVRASTSDGSALTPMTIFRRDAYGNAVVKIDLAKGAAAANEGSYTQAVADAGDRKTLASYDRFGHVVQITDAQSYDHYRSYDARGNLAKEWQAVTGSDGATKTLFRAYQYDKLGHQTHVIDPASTTVLQGGLYTQFGSAITTSDEGGNLTLSGSNSVTLNWSDLTDAAGGLVRVQIDYQTLSTQGPGILGEGGYVSYTGLASHSASRTQDFSAASASGGVSLGWVNATVLDGGISRLDYIRVWQQDAGGNWVIKWQGSAAQANGSGINNVTQAQAGVVDAAVEYNAFGEVTRKGINGGRQEYFDYDNAGHLWRTNSGDGVDKVALYDLQGYQTANIRSAGVGRANVNLQYFTSADQVAALTDVRREDIRYDALGHVTQRLQAERVETQGGVAVQRNYNYASVAASATVATRNSAGNVSGWSGTNSIALSWTSLGNLGSGDVKVVVDYTTQTYTNWVGASYSLDEAGQPVWARDEAGNIIGTPYTAGGVAASRTQIVSAESAASGITMSWQDPAGTEGGISRVSRLRLFKRDLQGNWQQISDQTSFGYTGNTIEVAVPTDAGTDTQLQIRPAGTAGAGGWSNLALINFGDAFRYDAASLPMGSYEYRVLTTPPGGATSTSASGTLALTLPPLSTISIPMSFIQQGVYGWQSPGGGVEQVLRFRPAGSTGAWQVRSVNARGGGYDGADLNGIAAGNYEYEVIWSRAGEGVPYAHATGQITVAAATTTTQTVTPPNPANYITGYTYAEYSSPIVTMVPVLGEGGLPVYGENGLPIYETKIAAHYQYSGYVIVGVPYSVTQLTGYTTEYYTVWNYVPITPLIVYDEYGQPSYVRDEAGNIQYQWGYVPQTLSRQVPVYSPVTVYPPDPTPYMTVASKPIYGAPIVNGGQLAEHYQWSGNVVVAVPYTVSTYVPPQYSATNTTAAGSASISQSVGANLVQAITLNGGGQWTRPIINQKTDRWGNVLEINDPRSISWKTTYRYNANNQLVQQTQTDAAGNQGAASPVTSVYYDRLGRQVAVKDANGNINGQVFDLAGNLVQENHADGSVASYRYNAFGDKTKATDARGFITTYNYDKLSRLLSTVRPVVGIYSVNGSSALQWVATQAITETNTWDQAGRKLSQTNGNGETIRYVYDLRGNAVTTTQPMGQQTKAAFDAQGRKTAELDANNYASTWSYDYFGLIVNHTDLGGAKYSYTYDNARQLTWQTNTRGQNLSYNYDAAGQLLKATDAALGKVSTYAWDLAGHQIREKVVQGGVVYQDNHMAYDALGRLRWVDDTRAFVTIDYDKMGNRTHVQTHAAWGDSSNDSSKFYQYDSMNRQIVVDAVDAAGNLGTQGHRITYDGNGNRTSDTYLGNKVSSYQVVDHYNTVSTGTPVWVLDEAGQPTRDESGNPIPQRDIFGNIIYQTQQVAVYRTDYSAAQGTVTETYAYDGLNRMTGVARDGVQLDTRYYDGANRVLLTGPSGTLPVGYVNALNNGVAGASGSETRINRYDANGRLLHQKVLKSDNSAKYDIDYGNYDAAGNLLGYSVQNYDGTAYTNTYSISQKRFEGYKEGSVYGTSSVFQAGTTTDYYDANGLLVAVTDSTAPSNNRSFVNDAAGRALYASQNGYAQRQLIVNGDVLGRYGEQASGAGIADFNFGYQPINGSYPLASPGVYIVSPGDTLQSIARSAYGDSTLWYRIAEANGLNGDNDLKVGQSLSIPNRVGSLSNNAKTFKPYDPSQIRGDTTPNLPAPEPVANNNGGGGCGGLGQILVLAIVVVVTIYTAGAMAGAGTLGSSAAATAAASGGVAAGAGAGTFGATMAAGSAVLGGAAGVGVAVAAGAAGAALGSIVGQTVGMAIGAQQDFNWNGVALAALSGGVSGGLGALANTAGSVLAGEGVGITMARAAVGNALTQGVGVVIGLQDKFDWRGVVASAIGAGVGHEVGGALGMHDPGFKNLSFGEQFGTRLVTGLAASTATAVARGGRIAVQQIATDAFGNALGQSLAESASGTNTLSSRNYANEMDRASDSFNPAFAYDSANGSDLQSDNATMQRQRDALYGWSSGNSGLGLNTSGGYGLSAGGLRANGMGVTETADYSQVGAGKFDDGASLAKEDFANRLQQAYPGMALQDVGGKSSQSTAIGRSIQPATDATTQRQVSDKLSSYANDWATKAVNEFNDGNTELGKTYLGYASSYYKASGDALDSSRSLDAAAPKFQLPTAAVGTSPGDLRFELKLGAAAYAIVGGNMEFTADINISHPFQSSVTEFEAGLGVGVGFKGKAGYEFLKGAERSEAVPMKLFNYYGSGQASDTGAISTKLSAEVAIPFVTFTALELKGGVQAPLTGRLATKENYGPYGEIKYFEPKISPALNFGATVKLDMFNTSYKRSPSGNQ